MKRAAAILLSAALASTLSTTAFAAGSGVTEFNYSYAPDPGYVVTIPAEVTLADGENEVAIAVSEAKNFNGGKVSVKIASTVPDGNHLAVSRLSTKPGEEGWWTADEIRYDIVTAGGEEILYNRDGAREWPAYTEKELASFTEDGSKNYKLILDTQADSIPGEYGGLINYSIEFIGA